MSWRTVVISRTSKLDYQMGYLVIRDKETLKINLGEISTLIIESTSVSLTAYLLNELVEKKIDIVFCDLKRNPSFQIHPFYGSHDTSLKVREQVKWSDEIKSDVWTEIVTDKIRKQASVLKLIKKPEYDLLRSYISEIKSGDSTNREGHAAKVYFNSLFGKEFTRTDENSINAALNYGYTLLLSLFNREIVSNGYLTQFGLFHDNVFNQFNLGSDLMEPFRPIVDEIVYYLNPDKFEKEEKREILSLFNEMLYINGRSEYLSNAVKVYTRSVFDALNSKDISLIKMYQKNEL